MLCHVNKDVLTPAFIGIEKHQNDENGELSLSRITITFPAIIEWTSTASEEILYDMRHAI